jgi:hypothetical protein
MFCCEYRALLLWLVTHRRLIASSQMTESSPLFSYDICAGGILRNCSQRYEPFQDVFFIQALMRTSFLSLFEKNRSYVFTFRLTPPQLSGRAFRNIGHSQDQSY